MAEKKARALGRGLDSMIPQSIQEDKNKIVKQEIEKLKDSTSGGITFVKITKVEPNRKQPRQKFDEDSLQELSESIKKYGLLEPILVQDREDHYEIIAGERRWRASRLAGLKEVPVVIGHYTELEILEISLIENIQREDINPIEEAMAYKRLMNEFNMTQDKIAENVSKSRSAVTNSMRLLKLCDEVQQMLIDDMLTIGHARALLAIEDPTEQYVLAQKIFDEKLNVRDVEKLVKTWGKPAKEKPQINKELDLFYKDLSEKLKINLGTKVQISGKGDGSGKIEIEFYSNDDLDRLIARIKEQ